jgi:hypothetical protein
MKRSTSVGFKVCGGVINIVPNCWADDEDRPAQRRVIDARLRDACKGTFHGPFETSAQAIAFVRREIRNGKRTKGT